MKDETLERIIKLCSAYMDTAVTPKDNQDRLDDATLVINQIMEIAVVEQVPIENKGQTFGETMKKFTTQPPLQNGFA